MRATALAVLALASLTLVACNTMEGAGKDVQNVGRNTNSPALQHVGQNLQNSAEENK